MGTRRRGRSRHSRSTSRSPEPTPIIFSRIRRDGSESPRYRDPEREACSQEDFVQRFKSESRHVKEASECMRISGFMHGITNHKLIKRLHDNIQKSVDEMMRSTTTASNQARKKTLPAWRQQETGRKQNFNKMGDFRNQQRTERRLDRFTLLKKSPKEILALDKGKFKAPPQIVNYGWKVVAHNEGTKARQRKGPAESSKKGEAYRKDKALAILMVQPWQKVAKRRVAQSFSLDPEISFPPLGDEDGTEFPMIIEAEIGGHFIHRIYIDGGRLQRYYTNIASTGSVRRTFNVHTDELFGGKITISIQQDHREARSKENSGSPVNSSWNVKIPSPRRNNHTAKHETPAERYRRMCPSQAEEKKTSTKKKHGNIRGSRKTCGIGIMKKFHYHSWLSNSVMVKKNDDSWRMCVDFKDLNKACPKDGYPLSKIDWKVEKGMFMGYMVNTKSIKVCPDKVEVVLSLPSPKISKRRAKADEKAAFKQMKKLIAELSTLTAPMKKEELVVYLMTAREAVSTVLMTEKEAKQMPVYFVSHACGVC
nr:reverse transcriptase domain-containing protein [Tanacetum cinerariifolium]